MSAASSLSSSNSSDGCRWRLAVALQQDDPISLETCLTACSAIKSVALADDKHGRVNTPKRGGTAADRKIQSAIKKIDKFICTLLKGSKNNVATNIHTATCVCAAEFGLANAVKLLSDYNETDRYFDNYCAVRKACLNGHILVVRALLESGLQYNSDWYKYSVRWATKKGHVEIVLLLAANAYRGIYDSNDDKIKDDVFREACQSLSERPNIEVVNSMSVKQKLNVLVWASKRDHPQVVELMLTDKRENTDQKESVYSNNHTSALQDACRNGNADIVKLLLADKRADPSTSKDTYQQPYGAMNCANSSRNFDIVKLLLQDKRVDRTEALAAVSESGNIDTLKMLLAEKDVDPGANENRALFCAVSKCRDDSVQLLMADPRVNASDRNSYIIQFASMLRSARVVQLLMTDPRVDPSVKNKDGKSSLTLAIKQGNADIVKHLLSDRRVDPSQDRNNAVILACDKTFSYTKSFGHYSSYFNEDIAKALLADDRVDPSLSLNVYDVNNEPINNCSELLKIAIRRGNPELAQMLVNDSRIVVKTSDLNDAAGVRWRTIEVLTALLRGQNSFWPRLLTHEECTSYPMHEPVKLVSRKSTWALLMCVNRRFTARVAARVKDVFLDIHRMWICFKIEAWYRSHDGNTVYVVGAGREQQDLQYRRERSYGYRR